MNVSGSGTGKTTMLSAVKEAYEQNGSLGEAKKLLILLSRRDFSGAVFCRLGLIYLNENNLGEAEKAYDNAIRINPYNALGYDGLGLVYGRQNLMEQAAGQFKKALEIDPDFELAMNNLAAAYADMGKTKEAVDQWKYLLKVDPAAPGIREKIEKVKAQSYKRN